MSKLNPIYTIYESKLRSDGTWDLGYIVGVTHWSSLKEAEKALRQHCESMKAYKDGTDVEFHEKDEKYNTCFYFTRWGNRYMRWIAQHFLITSEEAA